MIAEPCSSASLIAVPSTSSPIRPIFIGTRIRSNAPGISVPIRTSETGGAGEHEERTEQEPKASADAFAAVRTIKASPSSDQEEREDACVKLPASPPPRAHGSGCA